MLARLSWISFQLDEESSPRLAGDPSYTDTQRAGEVYSHYPQAYDLFSGLFGGLSRPHQGERMRLLHGGVCVEGNGILLVDREMGGVGTERPISKFVRDGWQDSRTLKPSYVDVHLYLPEPAHLRGDQP